ncbi:MAG: hypothetical protein M1537_04170 [Nitrospirae bacterium]|nr:hypothetical protein [Nitrospirota bacterium]
MAETKIISFSYKEIAEALIKQANIREGKWQLYIEFGIIGANIPWPPSPIPVSNPMLSPNLVPAAILPLAKMGLTRVDQDTSISVDASVVNPPPNR